MKASLELHPGHAAHEVPDRLFGSFVEHLGRCVYGGIFEPGHPASDACGSRRDVLDLVRELGVTTVRYPGGNFVSAYRWEDGVGPRDQRPRRLDPAWGVTESNRFGTDEFVAWCRAARAEPMLAVNLGTRGVEAALELLEYCNHPGGTALSDRRIAHGHREPHGVKMWCLGNEMDGTWQTGHKTAEEYGRLAAETARAMRQIDPGLELVLCGSSHSDMPTYPEWDRIALEHAYDAVDFISLHRYFSPRDCPPETFLYRGEEIERQIRGVIATCDYVRAKTRSPKVMRLSFDEWNVWDMSVMNPPGFTRWEEAPDQLAQVYTLADALLAASILHGFLRHGDRVQSACLAQLVNVIAPIRAEPGGPAWRQTIFHPFALISRHARGGRIVPQFASGPTSEIAGLSFREPCPQLDSVAVRGEKGIALFALNRSPDRPLPLALRLADPGLWRLEEHLALDGDLSAVNGPAAPDRVAPRPARDPLRETGPALWQGELPPASWHCIRLRQAEA